MVQINHGKDSVTFAVVLTIKMFTVTLSMECYLIHTKL